MKTTLVDQRHDFIDALRATAIIMVLGAHVVAAPFLREEPSSPIVWMVANLLYSLLRPCAALFVLISGALLLKPHLQEDSKDFLMKRAWRLFIPVLIWSLIYAGWNSLIGRTPGLSWALPLSMLRRPVTAHLWFMYMYAGITLSVPIFRMFLKSARRSDIHYALGLLAFTALLSVSSRYFLHSNLSEWFYIPFGYWLYFLLGFYLLESDFPSLSMTTMTIAAVIVFLATATGTYFIMRSDPTSTTNIFNELLGPFQITQCILLFKIFQGIQFDRIYVAAPLFKRVVRSLSRHAFGIYLCHILVMEFLAWGIFGFKLRWLTIHPFFGIPATWLVMLAISWAFCAGTIRLKTAFNRAS